MTLGAQCPLGGVLLLYNHPIWRKTASTIAEHVFAFARHSTFPVWPVNTELGFPPGLAGKQFQAVLFHYSLRPVSGPKDRGYECELKDFAAFLATQEHAFKVAFFQDEYTYCQERFRLLDWMGVHSVFTLLEPPWAEQVFRAHSRVTDVITTIPGYVSVEMVEAAARFAKPWGTRTTDVGYRGRTLPFYMGRESQEKAEIGRLFGAAVSGRGLRLDLEAAEGKRIYGDGWHRFLGNCRAMLGTEAGVSVFDLDGSVRFRHDELMRGNPTMTFTEMSQALLEPYEAKIYYRTISPRHFEAAAFRICQVLYEGRYSGILEPNVHYLPLKKDLSNVDDIVGALRDEGRCRALTERAHSDLVASGRYTYSRFVETLDAHLAAHGVVPLTDGRIIARVAREVKNDTRWRLLRHGWAPRWRRLRYLAFPGRALLKFLLLGLLGYVARWRASSDRAPKRRR